MQRKKQHLHNASILLIVCAGFVMPAIQASIAPFSTGSFSIAGLGDQMHSGWDKFSVTGSSSGAVSGLDDADPQQGVIGLIRFQSGYNCKFCLTKVTRVASVDFTYDAVTKQFKIPYTVSLNVDRAFTSDMLNFDTSQTLEFNFGNNQQLNVTTLPSAGLISQLGAVVTADLNAEFVVTNSVPEPSSWQLALTGAGIFSTVLMWFRWRSVIY